MVTMDQEIEYLQKLKNEYQAYLKDPVNLNIARGIPSKDQLDLSQDLLSLDLSQDYMSQDQVDLRSYGGIDGVLEARTLFAELLETEIEEVMVVGNASLQVMYLSLDYFMNHQDHPWSQQGPVKFLCPVPGYDRHFAMLDYLGYDMVPVPLTGSGPDMDVVEDLVKDGPSIKGIFCVPKYSNPTGEVYSDETIHRLVKMETAASDFKILWDNAYIVHHLTEDQVEIPNILDLAKENQVADRPFIYTSTSKMTLPGAGIAAIAASRNNLQAFQNFLSKQLTSFDKLNQKRQTLFLKSKANILDHMAKHAAILKPKFDYILNRLEEAFPNHQLLDWTKPKGGYFIHLTTQEGCAQEIVQKLADIGLAVTQANATYPKGDNPKDNSIRLAPTFASLEDLVKAMDAIILCVELVSLSKERKNENE
mgnify:CR=1 FL=1